MTTFLVLLAACSRLNGADCACPMPAHGALDEEERCLCLPMLAPTPSPVDATELTATPRRGPDWKAIDAALAGGPVIVRFAPGVYEERLDVLRTDTSDNRLVLDGGGAGKRASVPGVTTGYEAVVSNVTVRGFEVTGSRDKGVYWHGGDNILLEDLVVHDNKGSPAVNLDYSNRSGHRSTDFTVRNSHVFNQRGECVYIGGSEGEDQPSHHRVTVENNLIHDCWDPYDSKHDGINIKDRIGEVLVRRNVVFQTDWGIEVASPGLYSENIVLDSKREGFQVSDGFAPIDGLHFADNAVITPGHDGFHFAAENSPAGLLTVERASIFGAGEAGVLVAGDFAIEVGMTDVVVADSPVGFDGWGKSSGTLSGCGTAGNEEDDDRNLDRLASDCARVQVPDWSRPAGKDNTWFTADDGWIVEGGAQLAAPQ